MKVNITESEPKFDPIKIEITVESEEELRELWNRFNIQDSEIFSKSQSGGYPLKRCPSDTTINVWRAINTKLKSLNKKVQ